MTAVGKYTVGVGFYNSCVGFSWSLVYTVRLALGTSSVPNCTMYFQYLWYSLVYIYLFLLSKKEISLDHEIYAPT